MNSVDLDIKNFKAKMAKGLFTFEKLENGNVKIVKKRVNEDGDAVEPFEMETNLQHFDDLVIDNKMKILQERKEIAQVKIQIANKERDLNERESLLGQDTNDLRKAIEGALKK